MPARTYPIAYRGSVKNVRVVRPPRRKAPGLYVFEFTDDYSVFDYGKMPDPILGKGSALAVMSAFLFEELERPASWRRLARRSELWERFGGSALRKRLLGSPAGKQILSEGLRTHFEGLLDRDGRRKALADLDAPTNRLMVKAVPVLSPSTVSVAGKDLWDYGVFHSGLPQFLIPLENVFRFGLPLGSSLLDRIRTDPGYARELGLEGIPVEGQWLGRPVLEFSTKLEPTDRYVPLEAAFQFSGLDGRQFNELFDRTLLVAIFLFDLFQERGLEIWDGKLEFVKTPGGLLLADTITPDELRITCRGTQISKEPLRQHYKQKDREFMGAIQEIKSEGPSSKSVRSRVLERLGRPPRRLEEKFRWTMEQMYRAVTHRLTGSDLFAGSVSLEEILDSLEGFQKPVKSL